MRVFLAQAFEQCRRYIADVAVAQDVVDRILTVMESNDLVARALTLRVLGHLSLLLVNRYDVHHR